ncbi:MAG TPA: hypothetical protein VFX64_02425 [Candidatus Nitrosotalea sp.]|nr:hypothetical protein [Candidatus Nitrosotalea sp.]
MTQDLNPIPWGAQDRYQAHFIVKIHTGCEDPEFLAKPTLQTGGHFAAKRVTGVHWVGGKIADTLNADETLKTMMTKLSPEDAQIQIEPTNSGIRIFGKWKDSYEFTMTKELFAVYDRIALGIKTMSCPPPI